MRIHRVPAVRFAGEAAGYDVGLCAGGPVRTLWETAGRLNRDGLTLIGLIDSSLDDWDRYESLHWQAAAAWLREHPDHPDREAFRARREGFKRDYLRFDRESLRWALFVARVGEPG